MDVKSAFGISLYSNIPHQPRLLFEDEKICENRFKLYKLLQEANQKHDFNTLEWAEYLIKEISRLELDEFLILLDRDKVESQCPDVKKLDTFKSPEYHYEDDQTGHFLFALVSSKSEELKKLFLNLETKWFQLKFFWNVPEDSLTQFLNNHNIIIPEAPAKEVLEFKNELFSLYNFQPKILKVKFNTAPALLRNRSVLVKNGFLYFPNQKEYVGSYLNYDLSTKWAQKITTLSYYWVNPDKDQRMVELTETFSPHFRRLLYHSGEFQNDFLTLETIERYSRTLFPLCMIQLHCHLKETSHLKHNGRRQYAVFLKNTGMPYEDAMLLFESEMTKKISEQDFIKKRYLYYFQHCYGQVGGKFDYPPQSCEDIIDNFPSLNEEHGCPFAHSSEDNLYKTLVKNNIRRATISEILEQKRNSQYRNACCLYFNDKIKTSLDYLDSPNLYFKCAADNMDNSIADIEDIFC